MSISTRVFTKEKCFPQNISEKKNILCFYKSLVGRERDLPAMTANPPYPLRASTCTHPREEQVTKSWINDKNDFGLTELGVGVPGVRE